MSPERKKSIEQDFGKALAENPVLFGIARAQQQGVYPIRELMFKEMVGKLQAEIARLKQDQLREIFR